jgi:hypothetical protein
MRCQAPPQPQPHSSDTACGLHARLACCPDRRPRPNPYLLTLPYPYLLTLPDPYPLTLPYPYLLTLPYPYLLTLPHPVQPTNPRCFPLLLSKRKGRPSAKDLPEELTKKLGDANMMYTTGR